MTDRFGTQWNFNIFTSEVVNAHQVVILDGQSHVVFPAISISQVQDEAVLNGVLVRVHSYKQADGCDGLQVVQIGV